MEAFQNSSSLKKHSNSFSLLLRKLSPRFRCSLFLLSLWTLPPSPPLPSLSSLSISISPIPHSLISSLFSPLSQRSILSQTPGIEDIEEKREESADGREKTSHTWLTWEKERRWHDREEEKLYSESSRSYKQRICEEKQDTSCVESDAKKDLFAHSRLDCIWELYSDLFRNFCLSVWIRKHWLLGERREEEDPRVP